MIKIGGFVNLPYIGLENLEAELGYFSRFVNAIELVIDYPTGPHALTANDINKIKNALDSSGFYTVIHAPFSFNFLLSPCREIFEASVKDIQITAEIAGIIGANLLTVHLGIVSVYQKNDVDRLIDRATKALERVSKEHGVEIAIENLDFKTSFKWGFPLTIEEMKVIENTELFVALDTGHAFMRDVDMDVFLEVFRDKVRNVHIHDSDKEKAHLRIGKGNINFHKIIEKLKEIGYEGCANIEVLEKDDFERSFSAIKTMI